MITFRVFHSVFLEDKTNDLAAVTSQGDNTFHKIPFLVLQNGSDSTVCSSAVVCHCTLILMTSVLQVRVSQKVFGGVFISTIVDSSSALFSCVYIM